jgi:uncharacterized delta-60 repeat protein
VGGGYIGYPNANYNVLIIRYNPDGSIDSSFGTSGKIIYDSNRGQDHARKVLLQPDNKIVVCGDIDFHAVLLLRYLQDGTPDESFGNSGVVQTDMNEWPNILNAALQSDGKIVAGGRIGTGGISKFLLVRYLNNGTLDENFGDGGKVITDFAKYDEHINALDLQQDGKIVVTGVSGAGYNNVLAMARYNSNGSLDEAFGSGGKVITRFENSLSEGRDLALQQDGKIIVAARNYVEVGNPFD